MTAAVSADEYPDRQFSGTVDRMADAVNLAARTMRVEVLVPNADLALQPGDYVRVAFQTDRRNPPLEIPASALTMRPDGPEVAVVGADHAVQFRQVKIARDMGDHIEIASGLSEGESVAMNINSEISDGDRIIPRAAEEAQKVALSAPGTANGPSHQVAAAAAAAAAGSASTVAR